MFGRVIPYPPGGRKNQDGWIGAEDIKKAERAEIGVAVVVNCTCKTDRSRAYNSLQNTLKASGIN